VSAAARPLRILELKANAHRVCGPSRLLEGCLGNLDTARVEPVLALLETPGLPAPVHFTSPLTGHLEHHVLRWRGHRRAAIAIRELRRLIADRRIDGVHSHDMRSDWLCALAGGRRGLGVPWVPHIHGWLGRDAAPAMRLRETVHALALRRAGAVWVVAECSRAAASRFLRRAAPVRVLRNAADPRVLAGAPERAADLRASLGLDPGTLLVGTSARFEPYKGHRLLAEAVTAAAVPDLHALLLGHGAGEASLRGLCSRPPFAGRITVPGAMSPEQALAWVAALDVFAFPSLRDNLPLAVLEAMQLGKPIVASDVGDLPWALDGGRAGVIVPAGDVGALARALEALAGDPALRARLGSAARARADAVFSPRRLAREVEDAWLTVAARGRS